MGTLPFMRSNCSRLAIFWLAVSGGWLIVGTGVALPETLSELNNGGPIVLVKSA
jgi:hypothetical protein